MAITRKRARGSPSTEEPNPPTGSPTKKIKIILHCNPPPQAPPPPQPSRLPLQHFHHRGIVPLLATQPHHRFNHHHPSNALITARHAHSNLVRHVLGTLIKSGRRFKGSTPGITMKARKEEGNVKVRYEYWPVFDECVGEDSWEAKWPRKETEMGKPMPEEVEGELREYFFQPACIDEGIDFEV